MTQSLLESLGIYGGSFAVAFIAGVFPIVSIEVFLVGLSALLAPTFTVVVLCCLAAAVGHQIAKTITYYAGVGVLEGKLKDKLERYRSRIERWNKAPHLILVLGGAIGIPPLWILGLIAEPLMRIKIVAFTTIVFVTRFARFVVLAAVPLLF
jgi:membrane protein YqaA with SNARE-associated domain